MKTKPTKIKRAQKTKHGLHCDCKWAFTAVLTKKQRALQKKHGAPAEFALSVYAAVPDYLSMDEARAAVEAYCIDWDEAGKP